MTREVVTREAFLAGLRTAPREDVPLPELGNGMVIPVWGMSALERTRYEKSFSGKSGKTIDARIEQFRQRLVVACCRSDDGAPLFTEADVIELGKHRADVLERIVNVCQRLSGMTREDIEDTVKNSGETQTA